MRKYSNLDADPIYITS